VVVNRKSEYSATLYDLLSAYATQRQHKAIAVVHVHQRTVWSLQEAREILIRMIGQIAEWTPLHVFVSPYLTDEMRATVMASSFSASLELAREGRVDLRQTAPFAPLYMRDRKADAPRPTETENG
jgi:segregation and condensation protein A